MTQNKLLNFFSEGHKTSRVEKICLISNICDFKGAIKLCSKQLKHAFYTTKFSFIQKAILSTSQKSSEYTVMYRCIEGLFSDFVNTLNSLNLRK